MTCVTNPLHSLIHVAPHSIALRMRKRREGATSLLGKKTIMVNSNMNTLGTLVRTKEGILKDLL